METVKKTSQDHAKFVDKILKRAGEPSGNELPIDGKFDYTLKMTKCLNWYNSHQTMEQALKVCEELSGKDFSKTSDRSKVQRAAALIRMVRNGAVLSTNHTAYLEKCASELVDEYDVLPVAAPAKVKVDVVPVILGEVEGAVDAAFETGKFVFPRDFSSKFHLLKRDEKRIKKFMRDKINQFKDAQTVDKEYWNVRKPILKSVVKTMEKELSSL